MTERRNRIYFFYKHDEQLTPQVQPLIELAQQNDFVVVDDYRNANVIVSIGDDGSFLQAVRQTGFRDDCLYAGISTLPSRGFLLRFPNR